MVEGGEALLEGRFRIVRSLGAGGMGAVWLVEDRNRGQLVALKRIHVPHPRAMRRFKKEFRAIEGLRHPGLVRPLELGEDDEGLYLLVEYVDGVELDRWVFGEPSPERQRSGEAVAAAWATTMDSKASGSLPGHLAAPAPRRAPESSSEAAAERAERLAPLMPALLDALGALHEHDIVHRDLKPPNVLVEPGGKPRLLDFGVLAELGRHRGDDLAGTPGYIAPECIDGTPPSPSTDLYALGVMLFELLTGELPLPADTPVALLARTLSDTPPRLRQRWPSAPRELDALIGRLLSKRPEERPSLEELVQRLPESFASRSTSPSSGNLRSLLPGARRRRRALRGREREMKWLLGRLGHVAEGGFRVVVVRGRSGLGKSALCEQLLREAEARGALVLRGRARLSERVPFGGLDEAMDDLADHLARLTLPEEVAEPLRRVRAHLATWLPALAPARPPDALSARPPTSAGAMLHELLRLLASTSVARPLVLHIDDVQWLGSDAAYLLRVVAEQRPAGVMLLLAERTDASTGSAAGWLRSVEVERLPLTPLSNEVLAAIFRDVLGDDQGVPSLGHLAAWMERCEGLPLLAEISARAVARGEATARRDAPEAFVEQAIASLGVDARRLLSVLMASDDWVQERVLAEVLRRPPGEVESTLMDLRALGLVRWSGGETRRRRARLYHDAVRTALDRLLSEAEQRDAHAAWAHWLSGRSERSALTLVHHLVGAGLYEEAFRMVPEAVAEAEGRRAWALAARMAAVALLDGASSDAQRGAWSVRRAEYLGKAGLYEEAARSWEQAARWLSGEERQAALLGAAGALLAAGHVVQGRERLTEATGGARGRLGPLARGWAALRFFRGPHGLVRSGPPSASREERAAFVRRMELDVRAGTMLGYFDPLEGLAWLQRVQRSFERVGAAAEAAWCDFVFAYMGYFGAEHAGPVPLAERYREAAEARRDAASESNPRLEAMTPFLRGLTAKRQGRWDEAAEAMDDALSRLDAAGIEGSFEHALLLVHRTQVALFSERIGEVIEWIDRLREASRGRGASAVRCHLLLLELFVLELTGEPETLRRTARAVLEELREPQPLTFQGFLAVFYSEPLVGLLDDPAASLQRCHRALKDYRRFRPMRSMYAANFASLLLRLEAAASRGRPSRSVMRRANRLAYVARNGPPFQTIGAERALARLEERFGEPAERVVRRLQRAEERAERLGQRLQWALCHHARGMRIGGETGRAMRERAREVAASLGVREDVLVREERAGA